MNNKKHIQSIIKLNNNVILMMLFDNYINNHIITFCDVRLIHNNKTVNIININYNLPKIELGKDACIAHIRSILNSIIKFDEYIKYINNEIENNNVNIRNTKYYFSDYICYIKNKSSDLEYLIDYDKLSMNFASTIPKDKKLQLAIKNKSILLNDRAIKILLSELNKFKNSILSYIVNNELNKMITMDNNN